MRISAITQSNKKRIQVQEENHALIKKNIELTEKVWYLQSERSSLSPNPNNHNENHGNLVNMKPQSRSELLRPVIPSPCRPIYPWETPTISPPALPPKPQELRLSLPTQI